MGETVIYVRATRAAVMQAIFKIPEAAKSGGALADAMMVRCGLVALGRIKEAFVTKSSGGTDEAGERWKPLSPKTIAYSRRHPGVPHKSVRAASAPSWMLTTPQRDKWWEMYRRGLAMYRGDKSHAARRAWFILKRAGATTLMDKYGHTQVEILRDTGLLLNSLSPGVTSAERVFRTVPGEVIVGTNRKWAGVHHRGSENGRIPQRRLWPEPGKWPSIWWIDLLEQARQGLVDIAIYLAGGA